MRIMRDCGAAGLLAVLTLSFAVPEPRNDPLGSKKEDFGRQNYGPEAAPEGGMSHSTRWNESFHLPEPQNEPLGAKN